jgi:hypothetical protein
VLASVREVDGGRPEANGQEEDEISTEHV